MDHRVKWRTVAFLCALHALSAHASPVRSAPDDWSEVDGKELSERLYRAVGLTPRLLKLSQSLVVFLEGERLAGTPLLFVHGLGGSMGDWARLIPVFAKTEPWLALNLPGFGGSLSDDGDYSVSGYVRTLREFLARLDKPRVHLVCHSLGGQTCIGLALESPRSVASLTLIDAAGVYDKGEFLPRLAESLGRVHVGRVPVKRNAAIEFLTGDQQTLFHRMVGSHPFLLATFGSLKENLRGRVRDIEAPTQIVWGADDPLFPVENAFHIKENIPGSRLKIVPGAGHVPQIEKPHLVARWMREFLDSLSEPK